MDRPGGRGFLVLPTEGGHDLNYVLMALLSFGVINSVDWVGSQLGVLQSFRLSDDVC